MLRLQEREIEPRAEGGLDRGRQVDLRADPAWIVSVGTMWTCQ